MNTSLAQGLGSGTTILGNHLGYAYPITTLPQLCKIYGYITKLDGTPVGTATKVLKTGSTITLEDGWNGVTVTAALPAASVNTAFEPDRVVGSSTLSVQTNSAGYFELFVIQGLTVALSCQYFGKVITVDTTGETIINISTLV